MTPTIEDRLRAHYEDRTTRQQLPGPEADVRLRRAREGTPLPDTPGPPASVVRLTPRRSRRRLVIALAAAAAVVALVVALAPGSRNDSSTRIGSSPSTEGDVTRAGPTTVPTTEPPGSTASTATTEPASPGPAPGTQPTGPIVTEDGVLGWWDGRHWIRHDSGVPVPAAGGEEYQLVRLAEPITRATGSAPYTGCDGRGATAIDVVPDESYLVPGPRRIAVRGVAEPRPRPVETLDPASAAYRQAAVEVLAGLGIDDPDPELAQVVRSDLDGDGAAEVVVVAERLTDPNQPPAVGDYSVAFLRRSVGGGVETTVLDSSLAQAVDPPGFPFLSYLRLSAVADLNGDGRTELLLGAREYESAWTRAYELQADGNVVAVLDVGCGL